MPLNYTPKMIARFWPKVDTSGDCWIWIGTLNRERYGIFYVGAARYRAHRVAYELTYGTIPDGLFVCHACDNPQCVRPDHLWLGTSGDNSKDAANKQRTARGERHGSKTHPERIPRGNQNGAYTHPESVHRGERVNTARLSAEIVTEIRQRYTPKHGNISKLAREYGVDQSSVWAIIHRKTWKHIP